MNRESPNRAHRALALVAVMLACVAAGAGCGDGDGGGGASEGGVTTVKVGLYPVVNFAPLYLGMEKGFFRQERLKIEPKLSEGGAEVVPQLVSGETQIGFSNPVTVLLGAQKGVPLKIISQASQANTPKKDFSAVVVPKGSPIRTARDLEGKTVAVNLLDNIGDVTIRTAMEKQGADPRKVKFTEVPFPEMNAALDARRVDATWNLEPFLTEAKDRGGRVLFYNYAETAPRLTNTIGFVTEQYLEQDRDVVRRFQSAYDRSLEYAQRHPAEARQAVSEFTKIEPATLKRITLPYWSTDLNEPSLQTIADGMKKYGVSKERIDVSETVEQP
jgi:NitT/TauT family transport system substrate-binding protein